MPPDPRELRSSIPSMVPIERETRLPSTIEGVPEREVPDRRRTGDAAADDVRRPTAKANSMEATATVTDDNASPRPRAAGWGRR